MSDPALKLGKYEILRELGRGAMGVVYEAFDTAIERTVALKTIRRDQLEGPEAAEVIARFQREAKAAGRLNHPNVVAVYDFGEDNATMYIAMEFVHGRELRSYFENNERFPIAEVARIMGQLLDALEYSHNYGVVHRDIKPANIIIQPNGNVKVADFGIARIESSQYTQAGAVLGTPAYMSPEQFMGQTVDRRSDIFSAGIVLYQFLTGERPFTGAATTIMHKVLTVEPPAPSMLNVQVPNPFDAVVAKAMAKRPEDRFQTAREFAQAIALAAEGKPAPGLAMESAAAGEQTFVNAKPASAPEASTTATLKLPPQAGGAAPPGAVPAGSTRKSPALVVGAITAGIIGLGIASYFMMPHPQSDSAQNRAVSAKDSAVVPASAPSAVTPPQPRTEPGTMIISAVGLANPNDQKYQSDKSLMTADLRADSKSQLVEKAIALYVEHASLNKNYTLLRDKLLSRSGEYIANVVQEGAPQLGKDGLMYVTTQATVKIREVQKALNQMSRDERIDFIRNNGDPKIAVSIGVQSDNVAIPAQNSPIAENLLKDKIQSFGFRVWSGDGANAGAQVGPDFAVVGEARLKKLSARLEASGITIEKYMLTSWTVKCVDKQTGEEIYYNNKLPNAAGSWPTQEQALAAIGGKIADEFSRDFFIKHFNATGRHVALAVDGLPDRATEDSIAREILGLQPVINIARRANATPLIYDLQLSGDSAAAGDFVANAILKPLNAKLGQNCFNLGASSGEQVSVTFDAACRNQAVLSRLDTNPPASLYAAPPERQRLIIKDPEAVRRLII